MSKLKTGMMVILLATVVLAAPGGEKGEKRGGMYKDLNLTEAQSKQLKSNREKSMEVMRDNQEKTRQEYQNLFAELAKNNYDNGKIAQIKKNILDLEAKRLDAMVDNAVSLKKVLNEEQFAKFQAKQKTYGGQKTQMYKEKKIDKKIKK